jgi:integrase
VLGLKWRNVDFKAGTVRLEPGTTKNKEGRMFFMTDELRRLLERRLASSKGRTHRTKVVRLKDDCDGVVFTEKNGVPIISFRKRWWAPCRAAGIRDRVERRELPDGSIIEKRHPAGSFTTSDARRSAT